MRWVCVVVLTATVLGGCSVDIDTGGEEPRPTTGDPTVNKLREYDAREKANEDPENAPTASS